MIVLIPMVVAGGIAFIIHKFLNEDSKDEIIRDISVDDGGVGGDHKPRTGGKSNNGRRVTDKGKPTKPKKEKPHDKKFSNDGPDSRTNPSGGEQNPTKIDSEPVVVIPKKEGEKPSDKKEENPPT